MGRRRNRGRTKPKIADLSRAAPTREEVDALAAVLENTDLHPVSAAILGAVLVENELDNELQRLLPRKGIWTELTTEVGPLSTFHRKIVLGHALHLYNDDFRANLEIVKAIRNQFAHSKRIINFSNPLIAGEIAKAKIVPNYRRDFKNYVQNNPYGPQGAYLSLCILLTCALMRKSTNALRVQTNRLKKRTEKKYGSLVYKAIAAGLLNQKQPADGLIPTNALVVHSSHPKPSTFLGQIGEPPLTREVKE